MDMLRSMMSFFITSCILLGYALEIAIYILNLMTSKLVPLIPKEMWKGHKLSLQHIHIWGCPTHELKPKVDKLEARSEVCQFVSYPKGMREHYFYSQVDHKVFVSTNVRFWKRII